MLRIDSELGTKSQEKCEEGQGWTKEDGPKTSKGGRPQIQSEEKRPRKLQSRVSTQEVDKGTLRGARDSKKKDVVGG